MRRRDARMFFVLACICWMSCTAAFAQAQVSPKALKKLSTDQLRKCYADAKVCGIDDQNVISEELTRRLPDMTTGELLSCFADWHICGTHENETTGMPISDEIARRGNPVPLMDSYWTQQNPAIRGGIERVAYHFDLQQVLGFMREVLATRRDDGENWYYPANYLAKRRCDPDALKLLSSGKSRTQGCVQFESTVQAFGRCKYRPAIPYLVDSGLSDLCENIVDAAADDLRTLYPKGPQTFTDPQAAQKFYCSEAKKEGFSVSCTSE
jgi:hypothetical protein